MLREFLGTSKKHRGGYCKTSFCWCCIAAQSRRAQRRFKAGTRTIDIVLWGHRATGTCVFEAWTARIRGNGTYGHDCCAADERFA